CPLKRIFHRPDSSVLQCEILREEICRVAGDLSDKLRRIRGTANAKELCRRIVIEKRDKHLVHGRIRECAEKYGAGNALHDFGNHLGFAGAWRSPDEMEDGTVYGTLDGLLLAAIQTRAERRDYRVCCRTVAVGRSPLLGKGGDFA